MGNTPYRSPLGVFYRSPLGVRGRINRLAQEMCMVFIDESSPYCKSPATQYWLPDVARWNDLIGAHGLPKWGVAACEVADDQWPGTIIPPGYDVPDGIMYQAMDRPPSLAEFVSAYQAAYVGGDLQPAPPMLTLLIDESGSMIRSTLEPGIDEFEVWLDNGGTSEPDPENPLEPIPWQEVLFEDERWLTMLCGYAYTGEV
jgi:hypothetical protein